MNRVRNIFWTSKILCHRYCSCFRQFQASSASPFSPILPHCDYHPITFSGLQLRCQVKLAGKDNIRRVGSKNRYIKFPSKCDPLCWSPNCLPCYMFPSVPPYSFTLFLYHDFSPTLDFTSCPRKIKQVPSIEWHCNLGVLLYSDIRLRQNMFSWRQQNYRWDQVEAEP
jgi:hypothetical protein